VLHALSERTNPRLGSDLAIAANLAAAAADAAAWNVRVNLPSMTDREAASRLASETDERVDMARRLAAEAVAAVHRSAS
jgi:formiminotetrahydrofolate cyclodeaminase